MANYITLEELRAAKARFESMSREELDLLQDSMHEQRFERRAALGGSGDLAPCIVEETGETVSPVLYELAYRERVRKLFAERNRS